MPLLLVATSRAEIVLPAPVAGTLAELLQPEGQTLESGTVLARFRPTVAQLSLPDSSQAPGSARQRVTPLACAIAQRAAIELATLVGTGDHGRILAADVRSALQHHEASYQRQTQSTSEPIRNQDIPLAPIPVLVPQLVQASSGLLPISTAHMLCDASAMLALSQKRYRGLRITPLACLAATCSQALLAYPQLTCCWSDEGLVRRKRLALRLVTAEKTLLIDQIDDLNLYGIVRRMHECSTPESLPYAFSVYSGMRNLNYDRNTAPALTLGAIETRPLVEQQDGQERIVFRPTAWLSLSYDARVLSIVQADYFLSVVIQQLERISLTDV